MKKLFLLATLLCVAVANAQVKTDLESKHIQGKAKKITEITSTVLLTHTWTEGVSPTPPTTKKVSEYNKKGFLIKEIATMQNGALMNSFGYKRSKSGKINKHWAIRPDGKVGEFASHKYNSKKQEVKVLYYGLDKNISNIENKEYNQKGQLIKAWYENAKGVKRFTLEYIYNDNDQLVKVMQHNTNNTKYLLREYTYYDNGLEKSQTIYTPNGTVQHKFTNEYKNFDQQGNWLVKERKTDGVEDRLTRTVRIIEYHK